jgi:HD-GYP domain-containing protein (c-di-GMP phosphodiesterase class II)
MANCSVGTFHSSGNQLPATCLRLCLQEDPGLACSHGCDLLRRLIERASRRQTAMGAPDEIGTVPAVCDQGARVSLSLSTDEVQPDVLVLSPKSGPCAGVAEQITAALRMATLEGWRLSQENNSLADEVLRGYEQINFIFDVSAHIAILNDAEEVRRLLLLKLRHMLGADEAFYISPDRRMITRVDREGQVTRGWSLDASDADSNAGALRQPQERSYHFNGVAAPGELSRALEQLDRVRRVFVLVEDHHRSNGFGTSLWGPLSDDGKSIATVGIIRRGRPFVAGDMLLLDSALTYGSHILSNLRLVEQLKRTSFEAVRALVNAIDQKDPYTAGHSERVGFLARITGEHMGLSATQIQELEWSGLLHDIGKIGIPESVLNKPGGLTPEELAIIKGHPSRSYEVLRPVVSLEPLLDPVLYHHENPDGTGYPAGLKGDEIPLLARIIHVVDVFDALTSTRSYRKAFRVEKAIEIIQADAGTKLDATIVSQFLEAWALLPQTHPEQYERFFAATKEVSV